jgi:hypothetical protein
VVLVAPNTMLCVAALLLLDIFSIGVEQISTLYYISKYSQDIARVQSYVSPACRDVVECTPFLLLMQLLILANSLSWK